MRSGGLNMASEPLKPTGGKQQEIDRRGALARLLQLAAGLIGLSVVAGCPGGGKLGRSASAKAPASVNSDTYEFTQRNVPQHTAVELKINGRNAYVIHTKRAGKEVWSAVDRKCTHSGCKLNWDVTESLLICPCHGSKFNELGIPVAGPAKKPLMTWPTELVNGKVIVKAG